jgi:hypothetical protein
MLPHNVIMEEIAPILCFIVLEFSFYYIVLPSDYWMRFCCWYLGCSWCPLVLWVQFLRWRYCSRCTKRTTKSRKIAGSDLSVKWKYTSNESVKAKCIEVTGAWGFLWSRVRLLGDNCAVAARVDKSYTCHLLILLRKREQVPVHLILFVLPGLALLVEVHVVVTIPSRCMLDLGMGSVLIKKNLRPSP